MEVHENSVQRARRCHRGTTAKFGSCSAITPRLNGLQRHKICFRLLKLQRKFPRVDVWVHYGLSFNSSHSTPMLTPSSSRYLDVALVFAARCFSSPTLEDDFFIRLAEEVSFLDFNLLWRTAQTVKFTYSSVCSRGGAGAGRGAVAAPTARRVSRRISIIQERAGRRVTTAVRGRYRRCGPLRLRCRFLLDRIALNIEFSSALMWF
ncbi:hypothetical protein EVAR_85419_1 [Eumeta japonica]|uniref:Uncharacterized protein n=1 Tax=Eumeta variegata TaxID=151549 RepID=A0A4C1WIH2_EUMVA|nr:hypothetical protein EVAR_85419_1 [Eumeta japonica]